MNKKIIVIKSLNGGGAERILINFAKVFNKRFSSDQLKIVVLLKEGELLQQELPENIDFVYEPTSRLNRYLCLIKLFLFKKQIARQFCSENGSYELISFLEGWPDLIIHSVSDVDCKKISWLHCGFDLYSSLNPVRWFFNKYAVQSSVINCVSNYVKSSISNIKNTKTVYNFIDIDYIEQKATEEAIDDPRFIDENKKHIVAVGRMVYQKNFEFLLRAVKEYTKHDSAIVLHLLGDGELRKSLEDLVTKLGIEDHVNFVGFVNNPYKYIKNADLVCMTSHFEGLPTVVIESAVLGTPVITTKCGARELLELFNFPNEIEFDERVYASEIAKALTTRFEPIDRTLFEEKFSFDNFLNNMK
ncbi:glycosyltransferase [Pseudoalteromonas xiamenensis]|uniref:glycosyltransferase n=1 Tax=Pseudoalteromonas xiamenensis TaxID=882626 RepID=UPI0035E481E9